MRVFERLPSHGLARALALGGTLVRVRPRIRPAARALGETIAGVLVAGAMLLVLMVIAGALS